MTENISILLAFGGGLLSFLSPCVLPLIPSYLSLLGGIGGMASPEEPAVTGGKLPQAPRPALTGRSRLLTAALSFVLGFGAVFVITGLFFSTALSLMGGAARYINGAAGIIVIILGFNILFDFLSFLNYEKRFHAAGRPRGILGAFFAGAAFAAGWTPCIGPLLTGILLMAAQSGRAGTAALYLAVYSAGLALPFLGTAVFFDFFLARAAKLRAQLLLIRRISGILLIIIGLLILTGRYTALNALIQRGQFRFIQWAAVEGRAPPFQILGRWLSWLQGI
jgi:cytochrome c-type biogenesis protein